MKKLIVLLSICIMLASCAANRHMIGSGSQTGIKSSGKQWYALWGLVPIGSVDTNALSGDAENYEIYTRVDAGDWFINVFLGIFTIQTRSVTVIK